LTARHKEASRCLHKTFEEHWMLLVLAACFCAARINPDPGAAVYSTAITILVPALFCIVGLTIDLRALTTLADVDTVAANLLCQSYSLVVMPLVYYISVYHWQWEVHTGIVSSSLSPGIMAAMCMPTTTSTGILFTREAGGDDLMASVNCAIGNLLGAFIAPVMAQLLIGASSQGNIGKRMIKLMLVVFVPSTGGVILQYIGQRYAPQALRHCQRMCKWLFRGMLVTMLYLLFCKVLDGGAKGLSFLQLIQMVGFVTLLHAVAALGAWWISIPLDLKKRITMVYVASQKSEGMSIPIISAIFDSEDVGLYILPVVVYHTVQMILASALIGPFKGMVQRQSIQLGDQDGSLLSVQLLDTLDAGGCAKTDPNVLYERCEL